LCKQEPRIVSRTQERGQTTFLRFQTILDARGGKRNKWSDPLLRWYDLCDMDSPTPVESCS
jgi:hypothetical protein